MGEFKVIETQEEFDNAIRKRLAQKDAEMAERYKGYMSAEDVKKLKDEYEARINQSADDLKAMTEKLSKHDAEVADLTARAVKAETALLKGKVASAHGIPIELSGRLVGDTEEELSKDAEMFASLTGSRTAPPLRSSEPSGQGNPVDSALASMLSSLTQN